MLKITICLLALAAGSWGASIGGQLVSSTTERREIVPLLRFETEKNPDGSFHFEYEGGDQSYRQEQGQLQNAGTEDEALEVSGSYRYIDADGNTVEVHYTAGRNGFVPIGTIIPKEITAVAQAAADLPNNSEEEELRLKHRKARSQDVEKEAVVVDKEAVSETKSLVPAESQIVPVVVEKEAVSETKSVVVKDQAPAESQIVPVVVEKEAVSQPKTVVAPEAVAEKKDQVPAESQIVPVQVVLDAQPKSETTTA